MSKRASQQPDEPTVPHGSPLGDEPLPRTVLRQDPLVGMELGPYRVIERLGDGAMGLVYRAEQPAIGKSVVVKVLRSGHTTDSDGGRRLLGEARAAATVRHPNIVDVYAFGELPDGRPYLVMELLEGSTLAQMLAAQRRLSPERVLEVLDDALAALEAAHEAGVIHRDLKPANIFVDNRKEQWRTTLLDFGLARRPSADDGRLTGVGMVLGTPAYMSPEQVRGLESVSTPTDIYALGVTAWAALAGRPPFSGASALEVMRHQLESPVPPLRKEVSGVPAELEALVLRMMHKDPSQRPTAAEARREIAALRARPTHAPALAPAPKAPAPHERAQSLVAAAVLAVSALALVVYVLATLASGDGGERPDVPATVDAPPPRAVARQQEIPTPVAPVEPRDAPAPAPPSPAAPPTTAPEASTLPPDVAKAWRCDRINSVGPVYLTPRGDYFFFNVRFKDDEPVMITTDQSMRKKTQETKLRRLRDEIERCVGASRILATTRLNEARRPPPEVVQPYMDSLMPNVPVAKRQANVNHVSVRN